jgi:hypothetical protein
VDLLGRVGVAAVLAPPGNVLGPRWNGEELAARGLRTAYSGIDGTVFEVVDRPGRALFVDNPKWVTSQAAALTGFTDASFDVRRQIILEGRPGDPVPGAPPATASTSSLVTWVRDQPDELQLNVTSDQAGWLLVLDSWDPGWHASVNGRAAPIVRADYSFRAVRVPRGTSVVRFSYRPTEVLAGAAISLTSTAVVLAILVVVFFQHRRPRRSSARHVSA